MRVDVEVFAEVLEACGTRSVVEEAQRFGALQMRCSRRDIEVWRCGGTLQACCL